MQLQLLAREGVAGDIVCERTRVHNAHVQPAPAAAARQGQVFDRKGYVYYPTERFKGVVLKYNV
eukprot:364585-Chlamydomonas_euryale.AAC.6